MGKRATGKRASGAARHNGAPVRHGREDARERSPRTSERATRQPEAEDVVVSVEEYDEGEDLDENYDDEEEEEEFHPEHSEEEY